MPFLVSGGVRIHFHREGEGPPLLLSHGVIENSEAWAEVVDHLKDRFQVVVLDARGRGRSDTPPQITFGDLAEDVAALAHHLGWTRFFHAGHSMGGRVALEHAAAHPDQVAALATVSARPGAPTEEGRQAYRELIERTLSLGTGASVEMWIKPQDPLYARARAISLQNPLEGTVAALQCLARMEPFTPRLPLVEAPLLAVAGSRDEAYVRAAAEMRAALPGTRIEVLDGIGHFPNLESPADLAELLAAHFLAAQSRLQ